VLHSRTLKAIGFIPGFANRGTWSPLGFGAHEAVLRGSRAETFINWLCRDVAKPKTKIDIFIDEQGAASAEGLWKGATNHGSLRNTALCEDTF